MAYLKHKEAWTDSPSDRLAEELVRKWLDTLPESISDGSDPRSVMFDGWVDMVAVARFFIDAAAEQG